MNYCVLLRDIKFAEITLGISTVSGWSKDTNKDPYADPDNPHSNRRVWKYYVEDSVLALKELPPHKTIILSRNDIQCLALIPSIEAKKEYLSTLKPTNLK